MGMDKEATDIWVFGRSRPDLTIDETRQAALVHSTIGAECPDQAALDAYTESRAAALIPMVLAMRATAKAQRI
jgi:hypothetical protein